MAIALERYIPSWAPDGSLHFYIGGAILVLAVILGLVCVVGFTRAGTNVPVHQPTTAIVTTGPYRYSRNPIYVALTLLYLGIILMDTNLWGIPALLPVLYLMTTGVILREEAYLEKKFGQEYLDYKDRTGRWLSF